jgi:hypothetical protein
MAEITALQNYQKEILGTLDALVVGSITLSALDGISSGGSNNGLGTFPEAVSLSNTYSSVMQAMITNFKELNDLITAMANVLGKSAQSYSDTEAQLTAQFNKIVTQYESQSGGFTTPGSPTSSSSGQATPQGGTSSTYYSATPASGTQSTATGSSQSTSSSGGSIEQDNNANQSADTDSEM